MGGNSSLKALELLTLIPLLHAAARNLASPIQTLKVSSAPRTNCFQHGHKRPSILRNGIPNARRHDVFLMTDKYSIPDEVLQMANQHPLSNARNATAQFVCPQRALREPPQNRPFPAPVDYGQHGVDRTCGHFLFRYWH